MISITQILYERRETVSKALLFILWPLIAVSFLVLLALVFVITWPALLFLQRKQNGKLTFSFLDKPQPEAQDKL